LTILFVVDLFVDSKFQCLVSATPPRFVKADTGSAPALVRDIGDMSVRHDFATVNANEMSCRILGDCRICRYHGGMGWNGTDFVKNTLTMGCVEKIVACLKRKKDKKDGKR